jgi:hypothetical protein
MDDYSLQKHFIMATFFNASFAVKSNAASPSTEKALLATVVAERRIASVLNMMPLAIELPMNSHLSNISNV